MAEGFNLELELTGDGLTKSELSVQGRALEEMLQLRLDDIARISHPVRRSGTGEKGEPLTVGLLTLALIKSGALVAMIGCLKAIFARDKRLKVKIKRPDGSVVEIDAKNIDDPRWHVDLTKPAPRQPRAVRKTPASHLKPPRPSAARH
jgi:hypothetical protein